MIVIILVGDIKMTFSRRKFLESISILTGVFLLSPISIVKAASPLRPPGAIPEEQFRLKCIRCLKCVKVCPTDALKVAGNWGSVKNTPILKSVDKCLLCMNCINVCPTSALQPLASSLQFEQKGVVRSVEDVIDKEPTYNLGVAQINESKCIVYYQRRTRCLICYDVCPAKGEALRLDHLERPVIDPFLCYGCGLCQIVCPPLAIDMPLRPVS